MGLDRWHPVRMAFTPRPRWFTDNPRTHSVRYVEHFRGLAGDGADLEGEARFMDALMSPGSRILDAGCGQGRVGGALHRRGHDVVGVDADGVLIEAAQVDNPGPDWQFGDLTTMSLSGAPFDAVVCAGNVMVFMAPGTERAAIERMAAHLRPGGLMVCGFATDRPYSLADFDADLAALDLDVQHRFATWDLVPFDDDADFAVTVAQT